MARDLNIQNTTLDPNLYTYRQARDVSKTQVDWGTLTKTLSDDLSKIRDEREKTRQETIDGQRKLLQDIENTDKLSHQTSNTLIQGAAYDASQVLNTDFQLLTSGQIKLKDYKQTEQRVQDNFTSLKNVFNNIQTHFDEATKRIDEGLANPDEIANNDSLAGFGALENIDIVWQPNGTMSIVKKRYDEEGNELPVDASSPANVITVGSLNNMFEFKSTYVNPNDSAQAIVDTLGSFITSEFLSQQKVTSLEDFRLLEYEGKTNEDLINSMITELLATDQQKVSMLNAAGYTQDDFTDDPKIAEEEGKILMIRNASGTKMMGYKFTEQAEADMRDLGRQIIERQLDSKITNVKGFPAPTRTETPASLAKKTDENNSATLFDYVVGITTTDNDSAVSRAKGAENLVNANLAESGYKSNRIEYITRNISPDGLVTVKIKREGLGEATYDSKSGLDRLNQDVYDYLNFTSINGMSASKDFEGAIPDAVDADFGGFKAVSPTSEIVVPDFLGTFEGGLNYTDLALDAFPGLEDVETTMVDDEGKQRIPSLQSGSETLARKVLDQPGNEGFKAAVGDVQMELTSDRLTFYVYDKNGNELDSGWYDVGDGLTLDLQNISHLIQSGLEDAAKKLQKKGSTGLADELYD